MTSGKPFASNAPARVRGFGYLMVLFALAAIGIGLATAGEVWHTASQREREAQLLFVGHQFRLALASYRDSSPPGSPIAPLSLEELLEDKRYPTPRRHLRKLWPDPMTGAADWGLVKVGGRIVGVHSSDEREPIRTAFARRDADFAGAGTYAQWSFLAAERERPVPPNANPSSGSSP